MVRGRYSTRTAGRDIRKRPREASALLTGGERHASFRRHPRQLEVISALSPRALSVRRIESGRGSLVPCTYQVPGYGLLPREDRDGGGGVRWNGRVRGPLQHSSPVRTLPASGSAGIVGRDHCCPRGRLSPRTITVVLSERNAPHSH